MVLHNSRRSSRLHAGKGKGKGKGKAVTTTPTDTQAACDAAADVERQKEKARFNASRKMKDGDFQKLISWAAFKKGAGGRVGLQQPGRALERVSQCHYVATF